MERRLKTPLKFRHPCYEALTWFAARNYLEEVKGQWAQSIESGMEMIPSDKQLHLKVWNSLCMSN